MTKLDEIEARAKVGDVVMPVEDAKLLIRAVRQLGATKVVADEAERIANEAHLAADSYAYDLMRTVLRPLVGNMERSVDQAIGPDVLELIESL